MVRRRGVPVGIAQTMLATAQFARMAIGVTLNMPDTLTTCNGCGMHRLCREYEGLWLCVNGPAKCYRRRRTVKTSKDRRAD